MTPEQAFAEAMKYENRWNPYPFFDELRKTPVAPVTPNGIYAVTGYREIMKLAHDPRVSSDLRNSSLVAALTGGDKSEVASRISEADSEMTEKYGGGPFDDHERSARPRSGAPPSDAALRPTSLPGPDPQYGSVLRARGQRPARQG